MKKTTLFLLIVVAGAISIISLDYFGVVQKETVFTYMKYVMNLLALFIISTWVYDIFINSSDNGSKVTFKFLLDIGKKDKKNTENLD